ncbi:MAG: hypothetical protein HOU81_07155 [Hamadaea sp.]|uniref:carboxypeptidase regulatory-like domain-containing protein n=1 Tax=Hamadaea sp. TaxID=2024425 RepID=UPI0018412DEE|nr:carboxypeptidase regulatory-like domain-containing protein [Hamadaea sp.]NUR70581.1 hypothetical protein [Hamadaea sp.]NUT19290.1 hypothetical protein [Hamadaea sp.]
MRRTAALAAFTLLAGLLSVPPAAAVPTGPLTTATDTPSLPTTTMSGAITDTLTGAPVPGACVVFRDGGSNGRKVGSVCADDDGHYSLSWRTATATILTALAEAPGYFRGWATGATSGSVFIGAGSAPTKNFAIAPTGRSSLSGRITRPGGAGQGYAMVTAYLANGQIVDYTNATVDGSFTLANLPAASVRVKISASGFADQWWPGKTTQADAGTVALADGVVTTLNEQLLPVSPLPAQPVAFNGGGTVTDLATGQPVAYAVVLMATQYKTIARTTTGLDGRYAFSGLPPIGMGVNVQAEGYASTWAPDDPELATVVTGPTFVQDVALAKGSGTLLLHLQDYDGLPLDGRSSFSLTATTGTWRFSGRIELTGDLRVTDLPPGTYIVSTSPPGRASWRVGTFTVTAGTTTEASASHPEPGHSVVTVLDESTGAPVPGICVVADYRVQGCTAADGRAVVGPFWTEADTMSTFRVAESPINYAASTDAPTRIATETTATIRVRRAAAISTAVRGDTGGHLPSLVCIDVARPLSLTSGGTERYCSSPDTAGRVTFGLIPPGPMQLLVSSNLYSIQWLGPNGGTGDQRQASVVTGVAGQIVAAPDIQIPVSMTSISGTIVSAATGKPIPDVCPRVVGIPSGLASVTCSDANGIYYVGNLGPYQWPLVVSAYGYAVTWSGGAGNRFDALYVGPGYQTVDLRLDSQGIIAPITPPSGAADWHVDVFDARTGDLLGSAAAGESIPRLNTGWVLIRYTDGAGKACWLQRSDQRRLTAYFWVAAGSTSTGVAVDSTCTTATPALKSPALPRR